MKRDGVAMVLPEWDEENARVWDAVKPHCTQVLAMFVPQYPQDRNREIQEA